MSNTLSRGVQRDSMPYFFSKSKAAKTLKIRRKTIVDAVKSGALTTRQLPGHVREIITLPDLEQWIANLEQVNGPAANTDPKSGLLTGADSEQSG